ncbi:MAG: protein kinase domain-containing protein, partial [Planctomycetota bacterium]
MNDDRYQRASQLFQEAVQLEPGERPSYLDIACAGDSELRSEVESLLRCDVGTQSIETFDSGGAFDAMHHALTGRDPENHDRPLPDHIGRYQPIRVLGQGGMGIVYEATQDKPSRRVALKVLARGVFGQQLLRRFRQEAEILGRLKHPGIAQVFDCGELDAQDGGQAYIAMELIEGRPLTKHAAAVALNMRQRLELFASICDAVHHAHQKGVIHRDLKPDNILVTNDGAPKILDFGIARVTEADLQVTTIQTHAGQLVGTITYMSPEQVSGNLDELDLRSDIYALGVLLFELLAGKLPHNLVGHSIPEAVRVILEVDPLRLSSIDTSFRGDVDIIVSKALEKDASRRYASAAEMAADIRRHLNDEIITARPASTFYQLSKFARRNKAVVRGVGGVILALILGVIATTRYAMIAQERATRLSWEVYLARIESATSMLDRNDIPEAQRQLNGAPEEHRGWEWEFLHRQLQQWEVEIDCGSEIVGALALLPSLEPSGSMRVVAAVKGPATADHRIGAWDLTSRTLVCSIAIPDGISKVSRRLTGSLATVLTQTGALIVVDVNSGNMHFNDQTATLRSGIPVPLAEINDLVLSEDGRTIYVAHQTGLLAWDRVAGTVAWRYDADSRVPKLGPDAPGFSSIALAFDGSRVFASHDGGLGPDLYWSWNALTGSVGVPRQFKEAGPTIAVHPGGGEMAIGSSIRDVQLINTGNMTQRERLFGHTEPVQDVCYSQNGQIIASLSEDGSIRLRTTADHRQLDTFYLPDRPDENSRMSFSPDSDRLVVQVGRKMFVFKLNAEPTLVLRGHTSYVYGVE